MAYSDVQGTALERELQTLKNKFTAQDELIASLKTAQAKNAFKIQIEKFSGPTDLYSIDHFINKCETAMKYNAWNEEQTANAAIMAMSGGAYAYVYGLQEGTVNEVASVATWPELSKTLRKRFQKNHNAAEISRLLSDNKQKAKESVDDFMMRVEDSHRVVYRSFPVIAAPDAAAKQAERAAMMTQAIKIAFTAGLIPAIKEKVENQLNLNTRDEVLQAAQQAEIANRTATEYSTSAISNEANQEKASQIAALEKQLNYLRTSGPNRGFKRGGRGGRGRGGRGGQQFHAAQTSGYGWNSSNQRGGGSFNRGRGRGSFQGGGGGGGGNQARANPVFCYACKQWGHHYSNNCRRGAPVAAVQMDPIMSNPNEPPPFPVWPEDWEKEITHFRNDEVQDGHAGGDSQQDTPNQKSLFALNY